MYLNFNILFINCNAFFDWTLTWDVFKLEVSITIAQYEKYWTLTWDVFKF